MEQKEIIAIVEKAVGEAFNEETYKKYIDASLEKHLKPLEKRHVIIGELPQEMVKDEKVTFSQFLGDIRRACGGFRENIGGNLKHVKPEQLILRSADYEMEGLSGAMKKDLYEGTGSAGGYLVPTEESRELINVAAEKYSVVPGLCRQVPMRTKQITFPSLTGGLTAYWIPEATSTLGVSVDGTHQSSGEKILSNITLGQMAITAYVCAVKVVLSNQLLDDSDPMVDSILRSLFAEALGDAWDSACLNGAGSTTDPITGIHGKVSTNVLAAGAQFNYDDLIDLIFAPLHQDSKSQVQIIGNTYAEQLLMKVKDDDGQYVYKSPREDGSVPVIWGRPYYRDGNVPSNLGDGGNETRLVAGDFRRHGYAGSRMGITVMANPFAEPYFSFNQTAFRAEFRVGFNVDHEKYFAEMSGVPTV
jgi:HK97 family phage major capsid protein